MKRNGFKNSRWRPRQEVDKNNDISLNANLETLNIYIYILGVTQITDVYSGCDWMQQILRAAGPIRG